MGLSNPRHLIVVLLCLGAATLSSCIPPNPLAGATVSGSSHGGWGAPRDAATVPPPLEYRSEIVETEIYHVEEETYAAVPETTAVEPARQEPPVAHADTDIEARRAAAERRMEDRLRERAENPVTEEPAVSTSSGSAVASISRVSFAQRSDGRGLVVRLHSSGSVPAYRVEEVEDGRLQLTLFQTDLGPSVLQDNAIDPISHYSLHSANGRTVITLDVSDGVFYERQPYPDRDSDDLLLPLVYSPRQPIASSNASTAPVRTVTADAADSRDHWRLDCIVIDPGHGGRDPGAVQNGVREKDVALNVSLRVGQLVEQHLGIRVIYTRRDDRFIELAERGRIANESCGKLFVSIHANSATNRSARGTETFFLGMARSESARQVMERENSVIAMESDPSLYSGMDDSAIIMYTMAQSSYQRMSEALAASIENQFVNRAGRNSRGVKQAGFLVLWRASMPAVLVELGFLSNPDEARYLSSAQGQEELAWSVFEGIRAYKQQYDRGLGIASH